MHSFSHLLSDLHQFGSDSVGSGLAPEHKFAPPGLCADECESQKRECFRFTLSTPPALGHVAPIGDMPTVHAMAQSFSLANMVPQAAKHNGGAWAKTVEEATRKYAARARGDVCQQMRQASQQLIATGKLGGQAGPNTTPQGNQLLTA
jgi:hypothetical protein